VWWTFDAYWILLFFVITVTIALIWRPVGTNDQYARQL
jgi:hypothetical protein